MNCPNPLYRLAASPASLRALGFLREGSSDFLGKRPRRGAYFFSRKQLDLIPEDFRENLQPIGCGRCLACRLQYSSEWSLRLRLEASMYECNLFLTLTYDDDHIPTRIIQDEVTGELFTSELDKLDVSRFMKALRQKIRKDYNNYDSVRFFASGEYGDKTDRPHNHVILMNLPPAILSKLTFLSKTPRGDRLFRSDYFDSIWKRGFVTIGLVSPESIAYVARYALKKVSAFELTNDRAPVFALMSRRPGIGAPYFYKNRKMIESTGKVIITDDGVSSCVSAPAYFFYLMKNAPIRAHRLPETLHYSSSVLAAERLAAKTVDSLRHSSSFLSAAAHAAAAFSRDILDLPRPGLATSLSRLDYLNKQIDIQTTRQKKYTARYKSL